MRSVSKKIALVFGVFCSGLCFCGVCFSADVLHDNSSGMVLKHSREDGGGAVCDLKKTVEKLIDVAKKDVELIKAPEDRADGWSCLARISAYLGDVKTSRKNLERAIEAAGKIDSAYWKVQAASKIAAVYVAIGDADTAEAIFDRGLAMALELDGNEKEMVLGSISREAGKNGIACVVGGATNVSEDVCDNERAFRLLAKFQAEHGYKKEAMKSLKRAQIYAEMIESDSNRTTAYCGIAKIQMRLGDRKSALQTWKLAREAADSMKKEDNDDTKDLFYMDIADGQALAGDLSSAKKTFLQASDKIRAVEFQDFAQAVAKVEKDWSGVITMAAQDISPKYRNVAFYGAALAQARAGDSALALKTASQITDAWWRERFYLKQAIFFAENKQAAKAQEIAQNSLSKANSVQDQGDSDPRITKLQIYCRIAIAYADAKKIKEAEKALRIAEETVRAMCLPSSAKVKTPSGGSFTDATKPFVCKELAKAQANLGHAADAIRSINAATEDGFSTKYYLIEEVIKTIRPARLKRGSKNSVTDDGAGASFQDLPKS